MDFKEFKVTKDDEGRRIDRIAKKIIEDFCGQDTNVFGLIRKNLIRLNGKKTKSEVRLCEGDVISVAAFLLGQEKSDQKKSVTYNQNLKPEVVFKNEHILIVNKKTGINVQKAFAEDISLADLVSYFFPVDHSLSFKPGPLHRLDKNTSGLVCFSQSAQGALWFSQAIKEHLIKKHYYAVAEGVFAGSEEYADFIASEATEGHQGFSTVKVYSGSDEVSGAKKAVTLIKPVRKFGKGYAGTLLDVEIKTGRKHQIRAQCAFHGHPLEGDSAYGSCSKKDFLLQAYCLEFPENNPIGLPACVCLEKSLENLD